MVAFFFFNDTATTEIYTLSLHDALPISKMIFRMARPYLPLALAGLGMLVLLYLGTIKLIGWWQQRSEEHTSELQSQSNLVCRLLLEKKTYAMLVDAGYALQTGLTPMQLD